MIWIPTWWANDSYALIWEIKCFQSFSFPEKSCLTNTVLIPLVSAGFILVFWEELPGYPRPTESSLVLMLENHQPHLWRKENLTWLWLPSLASALPLLSWSSAWNPLNEPGPATWSTPVLETIMETGTGGKGTLILMSFLRHDGCSPVSGCGFTQLEKVKQMEPLSVWVQ